MHFRKTLALLAAATMVLAVGWKIPAGAAETVTTHPEEEINAEILGLTSDRVDEAIRNIAAMRNIRNVELMDRAGKCSLTPRDVGRLQSALPGIRFHYVFPLFGKKVSTTDIRLEFADTDIGDAGEAELRQALEIMPECSYVVMDECGFSDEVMAKLREDYRGRKKVVWRIHFAKKGSCLTDRDIIRYVYNLDNTNCSRLRYCEDAEYIDFGHNEYLSDCSWAAYMPKLKAIILSGSLIDDLSPFANCRALEFLEIAYCSKVKDISPLRNCRNLQMVNLSFTGVSDLSPLGTLNPVQLCCVGGKVPKQEQERFAKEHPDCITRFWGKQPYGVGWRYKEDGSATEYYAKLQKVFHYPDTFDTLR